MPVSTPAGTSTGTVRLARTRPWPGAGRARVRDDRAVAAAGAARARGHDVAEQRAHRALDRAGAAADVAGHRRRAGRAARAVAGLAQDRGVDLDLALGAEDDLVEVDLDAQQRVLAALPARARSGRAALRPPRRTSRRCRRTRSAAPAAEAGLRRRGRSARAASGRSARRRRASPSLKRSAASSLGLTSGCSSRASLRYAFLISSGVASSLDAQHLVVVSQVLCLSLVRRRAAGVR